MCQGIVFTQDFPIFVYRTLNMRHLAFLLACGLCITACSSSPRKALDEADCLMSSRPDSALIVLEQIPQGAFHTRSQKARHALLLSTAQIKNHLGTKNDSIAHSAYDYYRHHGTRDNRMKSAYYWGVIKENAGETVESTILLREAERLARKIGNYHYLGLANQHLSSLFAGNYDIQSAYEYAQKAVSAFDDAGEKLSADFSRMDVARQSYNLGDRTRAIEMADSLLACNQDADPGLRYTLLILRADIHFWDQEYEQAREFYEQAMSLGYPLGLLGIGNMAIIKEKEGQHAAADSCLRIVFEQMATPYDSSAYYSCESRIRLYRGEHQNAYTAVSETMRLQNEDVKNKISRSLTHSQKAFFEERYIAENAHYKILLLWFVLTAVVLSSGFLITYLALQRRKKQALDGMKEVESLTQNILLLKKKQKGAQAALYSMVQSRIEIMQDLANKYYAWIEDAPTNRSGIKMRLQKEDILNEFRAALNTLRKDRQFISDIEKALNLNCQDIMVRLRKAFSGDGGHKMTEQDFQLLTLLFAEFTPKCAGFILNMSEESVRMRKSRYKKLFVSMGKAGADFAERLS